MTTNAQKTIEVDLPVGEVYRLWTDFESFPKFMDNVEAVNVTGPGKMHWEASVLGVKREWDAVVTDQVQDQKIAWTSTSGTDNSGEVSFVPIGLERTRVDLTLNFAPEGLIEGIGDKLGLAGDSAEGDLTRFKQYAEANAGTVVADDTVAAGPAGAGSPAGQEWATPGRVV